MLLIRSIVQPLRHIIKVFRHIEDGKIAHWQVTIVVGFTLEE